MGSALNNKTPNSESDQTSWYLYVKQTRLSLSVPAHDHELWLPAILCDFQETSVVLFDIFDSPILENPLDIVF